jgi:type I restriction enzyme S subunit
MTEAEKRVPELRFKGFVDDWEQRELGDVTAKIGSGKTPKGGSSVYSQSGVPLLRSQNIHNSRVNFEDIVYITESIDGEMANSRVEKNDVLLNITGASIGRTAVYEQMSSSNVNQHVCIIRPKHEIDSYYIQQNLISTNGQKQIGLNQAGGGREGLNFQQIAKMDFFFFFLREQNKIGTFFKRLDDTIALHQRKLNLLNRLKKTYMDVLFPQNDENIPVLRFVVFSEPWEQRVLKEVSERVRGNDGRMN